MTKYAIKFTCLIHITLSKWCVMNEIVYENNIIVKQPKLKS